MKLWWKGMNKEEKREWYKTNKHANAGKVGTFQRRKFEMPEYVENEKEGGHQNDDDIDAWIPYAEYQVLKAAQGFPASQHEAMWIKDIADPTKKTRKHNSGAILLHHFRGMETRTGTHHEQSRTTARKALIRTADQMNELNLPAAKKTKAWVDGLKMDQGTTISSQPLCSKVAGVEEFPIAAPSILQQELKDC
jgi:hypothetical protein